MPVLMILDSGQAYTGRAYTDAMAAARSHAVPVVLARTCGRADVLKVGHHGSRYAATPEFAAAVHSRTAVISVGRHNTFGHPAVTTIATWPQGGGKVLRTDQCGAILLTVGISQATMLKCMPP
jgi:beta-lactamase superfamily II metal-dependent hydrolase